MSVTLSEDKMALFHELLGAIELHSIILHEMSFKRIPGYTPDGDRLKIGFNTQQRVSDNDPFKLAVHTISFNPQYEIKMIINENEIMGFKYHYGLVFEVRNAEVFERIFSDNQIRKFFVEIQLPRLTWSFLREEVSNAVRKCGFPPVTLPLMR